MSGGDARAEVDVDADDGRDESPNERLDRNWNEMLQELRVTQTGTQILTGFLLAIAFQPISTSSSPTSSASTWCWSSSRCSPLRSGWPR